MPPIINGEYKMENKDKTYTVWVGGVEVNDYLLSLDEANKTLDFYKALGYDDAVIENMSIGV